MARLSGFGVGVPNGVTDLYDPYPLAPVSVPGWRAEEAPNEMGLQIARGILPNPRRRNLITVSTGVVAVDLAGVIFHSKEIEVTSSPTSAVDGGEVIIGEGGVFLADEEKIILTAVVTGSDIRADLLQSEGAVLSRTRAGLFVARVLPQYYGITDTNPKEGTLRASRLNYGW